MFQLIIAVMAIGLTVTLIGLGVTHMPTWVPAYEKTMAVLPVSLCSLETAVGREVQRRGKAPSPIPAGATFNKAPYAKKDGGLAAYFAKQYHFEPVAPGGGEWRYGVARSGKKALPYVCLESPAEGLQEGVVKGLFSFARQLPKGQFVLSATCGGEKPLALLPTSYPARLTATFFVVPGQRTVPNCN